MERSAKNNSPLEELAGTAGQRAIDAFSVLGDETRLSILVSLWDAFEPWGEENTVSFSELRERVGVADSGQFNYHLSKLEGHFISKTDDGYELRRPGHQLVRAVIAGTGLEDPSFERTEISLECMHCGARTAVTYHDGRIYRVCTNCDGNFGGLHNIPDGALSGEDLYPASVTGRSPGEVLNATWARTEAERTANIEGVCDTCGGPMDRQLDRCDDHTTDGICERCGQRSPLMARFTCTVCKRFRRTRLPILVRHHPAVIAFFYERGVPLRYEYNEEYAFHPRHREIIDYSEHGDHYDQVVVNGDPLQVQVAIQYDGDQIALTLDESLDVISVIEPGE